MVKKCKWEKCVIGRELKDNALKAIGPNGNTMNICTTGFKGSGQEGSGYSHCCFWTSSKHPTHHHKAYAFWYEGCRPTRTFDGLFEEQFPGSGSPKWRMEQNNKWLNNPVKMTVGDDDTIRDRSNVIRDIYYDFCGLEILPVADKKWKGKL